MLAVDGQMEPGPFQPAKAEDRQARGIGGARGVYHNPLTEHQAERRTIPEFITPPRLIPMQSDIGVMERSGDVVDADIANPRKISPLDAGPSSQVLLPDAEVMREARIQDGGK